MTLGHQAYQFYKYEMDRRFDTELDEWYEMVHAETSIWEELAKHVRSLRDDFNER